MAERIIIIHRWEGSPEGDWYPWITSQFEAKGYEVIVPMMPDPDHPLIEDWIPMLADVIDEPDMHTHLIGHSVGAQTIMRYLETGNEKIGKVVFVAPWFNLTNLEDEETEKIAKPWLTTPIDYETVKQNTSGITAIFSDNDYFVPTSDAQLFAERLNAEVITEHEKGHFTVDDGVTELPAVLNLFA